MTTNITPVTIWNSGLSMSGIVLQTYVINDNMVDSVQFYYSINDTNGRSLAQGNLGMSDTDYEELNADRIAWILDQLNLTTL